MVVMAQAHIHADFDVYVEVDIDREGLVGVAKPGRGALDQQAFEGKVEQFHRPGTVALAEFGSCVECDAFETTTLCVGFGHQVCALRLRLLWFKRSASMHAYCRMCRQ